MTNKPSWRKDMAKVLIGYDSRYSVASLNILLDQIEPIIQDLLDRKAREIEDTVAGFSSNGIDDVDHSEYFKGYNEAKTDCLSIPSLKEE